MQARGLWLGMLRPAKTCCVQAQAARLESFDVCLWLVQVSTGTFYVSIKGSDCCKLARVELAEVF